MLLGIIFILIVASVYVEWKLMQKVKLIKWLNEKSAIGGMAVSLAISWGIGLLFGAAGTLVLAAGIGSTLVSEPLRHLGSKKGKEVTAKVKNTLSWYQDFKKTYRWLGITLKYIFIVLTIPIWLPVLVKRKARLAANQPITTAI